MKSGLFYILNFVVVALGRQTIPIKVTIDEVDGRRTQTSSQMTQPLADLRQQLRKLGLHPSDYTFSVFYNANQNDLIRIRLDSSSGQVRPPRFGYDRETVCGKMFVSRPCIDSYVLQAEPKDKSRNENTVLFDLEITINNINDHKPKFQTTKAVKKIREGSTTGHLVSLPKAVDQDSKDAVRTYKLQHTGNSEQYFEIQTKPRRGELLPYLRLVKTLDHETIAKFRMTLVAADAAGQTAKLPLEVEVVDANDNAPVWPPTTKRTITIAECDDRQPRVIAQFDATDRDSGKFGKLAYELSETNSQEIVKHFYIVDKQLRLTKEFDYEDSQLENPIQVEVDAKDGGGLTSSTTFTVNVTDCNDNPPMVKVRYVAKSVTENVQEEKLVARVLVTDRDSGENGRVDCHLDDNSKLHIEDSSEVVRPRAPRIYKLLTKVTAKFDRESQETYQTNLVCRDHGHKRLKGIVFITLKVNDTNDHKPIFESRLYKFHVMENLPPGSLINGLMKANDADTGRNSRLNYSLNAEGEKYFSLDGNTGQLHGVQLRLRQSFDREQQRNYTFQVVARDNGQPSQSATATVRVVIDDENDNEPRFTQNGRYIFNVTEALCDVNSVCSYRHAPIGQVHADDPDLGEFAIVTYKLGSSLDFGRDSNANVRTYFRVESNTGKIYTKSALNREQTATWQFEVVARNRGNSVYSSTATVIVNVLDINDNPPEFVFPNRGNRTVSIDESAVPGTRLVRIEAKDPDAGVNGTVRYKFEKSNHQSPAFDSYFQINKRNGTITLIRKLSKYKHRYINLLIRAEDGAKQPKQSRLANLRVVILRRRGLGPRGPRGGANGHGTYHHDDLLSAEEDGSMQVLLVLAGVVFFVFAALLGILVYMYASGRLGLPCPSCLGESPPRKDDIAVAAVANMTNTGTNSWESRGNIDSAVKGQTVMPFSTPQTLRRNQSQETGYYEQEHFPDIIHFSDETPRDKSATLGSIADGRNDSEEFNLLRTKSTSYAYIPVACEDRYMYSPHVNSLRKGSTGAIATSVSVVPPGLYQTMQATNSNASKEHRGGRGTAHTLRKTFAAKNSLGSSGSSGSGVDKGHKLSGLQSTRKEVLQPNHQTCFATCDDSSAAESCNTGMAASEAITDSAGAHAYTTLDASAHLQQLRKPARYNEVTGMDTAHFHRTQLKTPYITSSFV